MNFNEKDFLPIFNQRKELIEAYLKTCFIQASIPQKLKDAMNYSLLAGGKRLRPIICLSTASMFGIQEQTILPFAAGIEMIHTYSLIHDDLPAMDDDDLRRGKPTCHKAFNEATAILAGDALLTDAFVFMCSTIQHISSENLLSAICELALASGSSGMVGGQILDIENTKTTSIDALHEIHMYKTSMLFQAACSSGAILAGADTYKIESLRNYGTALGTAFQIVDDLLDDTKSTEELGKTAGSDRKKGKMTYPTLLSYEKSKELAKKEITLAIKNLTMFHGEEVNFLHGLALWILSKIE